MINYCYNIYITKHAEAPSIHNYIDTLLAPRIISTPLQLAATLNASVRKLQYEVDRIKRQPLAENVPCFLCVGWLTPPLVCGAIGSARNRGATIAGPPNPRNRGATGSARNRGATGSARNRGAIIAGPPDHRNRGAINGGPPSRGRLITQPSLRYHPNPRGPPPPTS